MESPRTTPESRTNGSNAEGGCQEIISSFGRFGLGQRGTPASCPGMNGSKNGGSGSANGKPLPEKDDKVAVTQVPTENGKEYRSKWVKIDEFPVSKKEELSPGNLNYGMTLAENQNPSIQKEIPSSWNYQSDVSRSGNHMNHHGYGDFSTVMGRQFSDGNHEISSTVMGNQFSEGFRKKRTYKCYRPDTQNGGFLIEEVEDISFLDEVQNSRLQGENYLLVRARTPSGSEELQRLLEQGNHVGIQIILEGILDSMFELMTDKNGHHVFGMLVEKCYYDQLQLIVNRASRQPDVFAGVALTDTGSKSIRKLIKRIKGIPPMEIAITKILRRRSFELLTHKTASHVIRLCFVIFGEKPILLFLEALAPILLDLAVDRVGCISVNNFLDILPGEERVVVLEYLATHSLFLSNDPSGNFVVQYLLDLNNQEITERIINCLAGNFEQLAQKQGGSHVIEKCMRYSLLGLKTVISEISKNGKALLRLARDQFGNYVIQTALKEAKMTSDKELYTHLLDALRPYYRILMGKTRGRHVAELIKDDIASQKAKFDE